MALKLDLTGVLGFIKGNKGKLALLGAALAGLLIHNEAVAKAVGELLKALAAAQ